MSKKQQIINQLKEFDNEFFNEDQKNIILDILNNSTEENVQVWSEFLFSKRKIGFGFDYSPEIAKGRIITLRENKKLNINCNKYDSKNENKLIIGDNYNALKALQLTHKNKIDIIYIDPPYNTESASNDGNNSSSKEGEASKFIYKDKFGRNGWLTLMKERLLLAKDLLTNDGVIFVSIDDKEHSYLKVLMDQIFGEENFISDLVWVRNPGGESDNKHIASTKEYILFYSSNKEKLKIQNLTEEVEFMHLKKDENGYYYKDGTMLEKSGNNDRLIDRINLGYVIYYNPNSKNVITRFDYDKTKINENLTKDEEIYEFNNDLLKDGYIPIIPRYTKNTYGRWRKSDKTFNEELKSNSFIFKQRKDKTYQIIEKNFYSIDSLYDVKKPKDFLTFSTNQSGTNILKKIFNGISPFDNPKPVELIKYLINLIPNKNAIILDFFAGSATTGHAVLELNREENGNRKFILCTNNENNIAHNITYERMYRIINGFDTNGKSITWTSTDLPFTDENLRVIEIDDSKCINLDDIDNKNNNFDQIIQDAIQGIKLLDNNYDKDNNELNIYFDLAALNPLEKK